MDRAQSAHLSFLEELLGQLSGRQRRPGSTLEPSARRGSTAASSAPDGAFTGLQLAAIDRPSSLASAPLTLSPAAESSLELRSELRRFDGASSLVHELLSAGLAAVEPTVCRCPACSQLFVTSATVTSASTATISTTVSESATITASGSAAVVKS